MSPLVRVLRDPAELHRLDFRQWDLLLRQARLNKLSGHIAHLAKNLSPTVELPPSVEDRFIALNTYLAHLHQQALREIRLVRAISPPEMPLLLLKGNAYLALGLPHAEGRLLSDVDLLLPGDKLAQVEQRLSQQGWVSQKPNDYDQRYYREWMHELPPLQHPDYSLELDLHHQILPPTGRLRPVVEAMWQEARSCGDNLYTFSPVDMLLHSAAHLFQDGDLQRGLRDLVDMDQIMRHYDADPDFWPQLIPRAAALDLLPPLSHALYCCGNLLETPIPRVIQTAAGDHHRLSKRILRRLFLRMLTPGDPTRPPPAFAAWLLYMRSHWLRMPPHMLTTHLLRKAWRRAQGEA